VNLLSLAGAAIWHIPLAITVMQILAIDLVAELFPIAALGSDPADRQLMTEKPRDPRDHILNRHSILDLLWCGILIGSLAFGNYLLFYHRLNVSPAGLPADSWVNMRATALTYLTIVLCQLGNIMQRRSVNGLFTTYQFRNKLFWGAMALSMACVLNIIYNPWISPYFHANPLGIKDWLCAIGAAAIFLGIREFQRWSNNHHGHETIVRMHKEHQARQQA
jgi:Ca2+-transporting ATPase